MKRSTLLIILVFIILKSQAQDYLISFAGTGDTSVVSSVLVENLNSGEKVTITDGDILHLVSLAGIDQLSASKGALKIYPNPMVEQANLTFVTPENGSVTISITDLSGKQVYRACTVLSAGTQSFRVAGIGRGVYFVNISGKNLSYSTKLVSQSKLQREVSVEKVATMKNTKENSLESTSATIDMPYTAGNQLRYKSISGPYSTIVNDVPTGNKTIIFDFAGCKDGDGNNYSVVRINTQIWMVQNLKTTKYSDGTPIPLVTDSKWADRITPAYCWYNNDSVAYATPYGALYNWYAVSSGNKLAPKGWHIPSAGELTILTDYYGGDMVAGDKLKESGITHWKSPNIGATNESGFTALPGGIRRNDGPFFDLTKYGIWWSATYYLQFEAWQWTMGYDMDNAHLVSSSTSNGLSVRCIKDY